MHKPTFTLALLSVITCGVSRHIIGHPCCQNELDEIVNEAGFYACAHGRGKVLGLNLITDQSCELECKFALPNALNNYYYKTTRGRCVCTGFQAHLYANPDTKCFVPKGYGPVPDGYDD